MNTSMSPLFVQILLHQYVWRSDPGHVPVIPEHMPMCFAQHECLRLMLEHGLITGHFTGFEMTPKGVAFVENILATPVPVERSQWVDPRFDLGPKK